MTWKPRYIVTKAPGVGGDPIPEDEPVLVIRAQDVISEPMLQKYIREYADLRNPDPQVTAELQEHLTALVRWQDRHPERMKVADR